MGNLALLFTATHSPSLTTKHERYYLFQSPSAVQPLLDDLDLFKFKLCSLLKDLRGKYLYLTVLFIHCIKSKPQSKKKNTVCDTLCRWAR